MRRPWGLRWWELAPELGLGLGLGVFLATEPDAATSALASTKAIVLMATVGVGWLLARLVLLRWSPGPVVRLLGFGAAAVGVLAVVVFPAYDDETVVEALPTETVVPPPADETAPTTTVAPAPQPQLVASAALEGIDHRATGTVSVYRQPSGRLVIGLEAIDIQPGPDYDVYVVAGAGRQDVDDGVRLDDLRGNRGTQYYDVPDGTDVSVGEWTVLVWCQTFAVPVAGATPV